MVTGKRLDAVHAFALEHAAAEAALSVAALGEPDDDRYLAAELQAQSFYDPAKNLGPLEGRWATPGGNSPQATIDVTDSVSAPHVYAVGQVAEHLWIAWLSAARDLGGSRLATALLIDDGDRPIIVGRAAVDPFAASLTWESAGGDPVPLDRQPMQARVYALPTEPIHAAALTDWSKQ